jgi:hypothetical protein
VIGAGQFWQIALAWVDWIAAGLEKNSPRMHDMVDHYELCLVLGLRRRFVTPPCRPVLVIRTQTSASTLSSGQRDRLASVLPSPMPCGRLSCSS